MVAKPRKSKNGSPQATAPSTANSESGPANALAILKTKLAETLERLGEATEFAKSTYQTDAFQLAETMMASQEGMEALYEYADQFDDVGLFYGGPWHDPSKLLAPLVSGCLKGKGVFPIIEILSDLRMLAIAKGQAKSELVSTEEALAFLNEAMALNLDLLFPSEAEAMPVELVPHYDASVRMFALIAKEVGFASLHETVLREIEAICAQRPIVTKHVTTIIRMAERIPKDKMEPKHVSQLERYRFALQGPTPLSREYPSFATYRSNLQKLSTEKLQSEAEQFARSINETGLVSPHHAVLLRYLTSKAPELLPLTLGLNDVGTAELIQNSEFVHQVCKVAILPSTAQSVYGLARMLERGLFSRNEIRVGLENLIFLDISGKVRRNLMYQRDSKDGATANSILLAGTLSVLGQPLGVGQGNNPTCQAARGISLWSQHAPGYLLKLLISAARDGFIEMSLEDTTFRSDSIPEENYNKLDLHLDGVSIVLVPHLDHLYHLMMVKVALRSEDSHKWVNPALYGRWVQRGFSSVFADPAQTTINDYEAFVRRFYATHHPAYSDSNPLMYPNPVGLCLTNSHGDYIGPHAISLQRVAEDPKGLLRAYFYNPNNEGRQNWGFGVKPSIAENGEKEGESSLPFADFLSRIYAFHYNPYEQGDAYAVPDDIVNEVTEAVKKSWGRSFTWSHDAG